MKTFISLFPQLSYRRRLTMDVEMKMLRFFFRTFIGIEIIAVTGLMIVIFSAMRKMSKLKIAHF